MHCANHPQHCTWLEAAYAQPMQVQVVVVMVVVVVVVMPEALAMLVIVHHSGRR